MMADAVVNPYSSISAITESKSPPVKSTYSDLRSDGDPKAVQNSVSKAELKSNNFLVATLGLSDSSQEAKRFDLSKADTLELESGQQSLRIRFKSSQETGRVAISVIDAETDEVIREIPSEEIQRISEKIRDNIGLIFDRNV